MIVIGRAPKGDWIYIDTVDSGSGWASAIFLIFDGEVEKFNIDEIKFAFTNTGKVNRNDGEPIKDIMV